MERCEGCGRKLVDDPGFPGALICPSCDATLLPRPPVIMGQFEDHADGCPVTTGTVGADGLLACTC